VKLTQLVQMQLKECTRLFTILCLQKIHTIFSFAIKSVDLLVLLFERFCYAKFQKKTKSFEKLFVGLKLFSGIKI